MSAPSTPNAAQLRAINLIAVLEDDYTDVPEPPESAMNWSDEKIRAYFESGGIQNCSECGGDDVSLHVIEPEPSVPTLPGGMPPWKLIEEFARMSEVIGKRGLPNYPDVQRTTLELIGAGPKGRMEVRVYRPVSNAKDWPVILYITGGAYYTCNLDERDFVCSNLASMKYRTAEDGGSYPDAQVDCYAALLWLAQGSHVGELGYDASKLVVVGESAGAHIGTTTLMRLLARRAAVQVRAQVHICASIHYGYAPPQYCEYFPGIDHESTLYATCLSALHTPEMMADQPPCLMVTAKDDEWNDRFRDDWVSLTLLSDIYVARLRQAGVQAVHRHYWGPGKQKRPHCFMCNDYVGRSIWALEALVDIGEWAHAILEQRHPPPNQYDVVRESWPEEYINRSHP